MPIKIDALQPAPASLKIYSPKFFDDQLTGKGAKTGVLSITNNPAAIPPDLTPGTEVSDEKTSKRTRKTDTTKTSRIPVNPVCLEMLTVEKTRCRDTKNFILIGNSANGKIEIYLDMRLHSIKLEEQTHYDLQSGLSSKTNHFRACYEVCLYTVRDKTSNEFKAASITPKPTMATLGNEYQLILTVNPLQDVQFDVFPRYTSNGWKLNTANFIDYVQNYNVYDDAVKRSEEWQTSMGDVMTELIKNFGRRPSDSELRIIKEQVKYIMTYNIPLDIYKVIYAAIAARFAPEVARDICKQNLNLLLSDTLNNLYNNRALIPSFTPPATNTPMPPSIQRLSPEQSRAVMSNEPLILVQSGAGTGKSTLILGRIDYLVHSGVKPEDITVLSFTNAAANHINEKNPDVHSMTIARMIHEIYTANFTSHELSSLDTIANSIEIYYPEKTRSSVVTEFLRKVNHLIKNDVNSFTEMNNFIEEHFDEVMKVLDRIRQTSLELEIIICYQKIDSLVEPPTIASKYLIIDEVQDNSIFEFVYTLRYIDKHKESLFIVGDCSQTLYEFRASNPRALNILENSGTFATYQLTVNYRSRREILDFANIALANIEANQYANIRLRANSLAAITEQSFLDTVWFNYHRLNKVSDFLQELPSIFSMEIAPYINGCLARGEQVAILAFTRREIAAIKGILEKQYPNASCISLVPEKMYNVTIMSTFIKKYWNTIKFAPYTDIINIVRKEIIDHLAYITYNSQTALPAVQAFLSEWFTSEHGTIDMWINQVTKGQLTLAELLDLVKDNMIQFEIRKNAIKQSLLAMQNEQIKKNGATLNANFLLSTIHSAKGLEFQNVIVIYRNENQLDEEKKRMYYVAFTRAINSEYILAYDTVASPQIQADYITVLQDLHAVAPAANSPLDMLHAKRKRSNRIQI